MEAFCIAVAKRLRLPGFGDRAITDPQGNAFPLNRAEDFYLRVAANIAFMGKTPVAPANQEDISLTGVSRILPAIQHTLKADEVGRVAFIYSRGGRFAPEDSGYTEQRLGNAWKTLTDLECRCRRPPSRHHRGAFQRLPGLVSGAFVRWSCD